MKKVNEIIDADLYPSVARNSKKSAVKISVFHDDELIDADEVQSVKYTVKPCECAPIMVAQEIRA